MTHLSSVETGVALARDATIPFTLYVHGDAANRDMDVWVLRIGMRNRDPFEIGSENARHLSNRYDIVASP